MTNSKISKIILISIDNLRSDCLSANIDKSNLSIYKLDHLPITPVLDSLSMKGTSFFNCYSAAPYTTASHASILTGLFPIHHGVREYYRHGLSENVKTLFQIFKSAGYITILATDFPFLIGHNIGFTKSVDHFIVEDDVEIIRLLNTYQNEKIFLFVHFGSVHNPFGLTSLKIDGDYFEQQVNDLGKKTEIPEQSFLEQEWIESSRTIREKLLRQRYFKCTDLMYQRRKYDKLMQLYIEGIEYFEMNRFKNFINQIQLFKNTFITILADHGEEYSDRAFGHYNGLWESIVKVPLIIIGKDIPKGQFNKTLCRTIDVAPTLLEAAGIDYPYKKFDGVSLLSCIQTGLSMKLVAKGETWFGKTQKILDFMSLCQSAGRLLKTGSMATTCMEYLRKDNWKLILISDIELNKKKELLFNIEMDPLEEKNIADQFPKITDSMRSEIESVKNPQIGQALKLEMNQLSEIASGLKDIGYLQNIKTSK